MGLLDNAPALTPQEQASLRMVAGAPPSAPIPAAPSQVANVPPPAAPPGVLDAGTTVITAAPPVNPARPFDKPLRAPPGPTSHGDQGTMDYAYGVDAGNTIPYQAPAGGGGPGPGMGMGGGVMVPGGWVPTSRAFQVQEGVPLSPETRKAFDEADARARKALELQQQAELEANEKQRRLMGLQANDMAAEQALEKVRLAKQASERDHQEGLLDQAMTEVREKKIDPDHWWSNKSTFAKITTGIGMALRSFGAALAHRPDDTFDWLRAQQDADIQAQRANLEQGNRNVELQRGVYAQMLSRFKDEDQAAAAARLAAREQLGMQIQGQMLSSKDAIVKANGERALAELDREKAQLRAKFDEATAKKVTTTGQEVYHPAQYIGGGGMGGGSSPYFSGADELYVQTGNGRGILVRSKTEAEKLRELQGRSGQIVGIIGQLRQMDASASLVDKTNPYSDYNKKRAALIAQGQQDLTVLQGQGAMSKGDQEVATQALGGASKFTNNNAVYDTAIKTVQTGVQKRMDTQAGTPVVEQLGANKKGQIERRYVPVQPGAPAPAPLPQGGSIPAPPGFRPIRPTGG